MTRNPITRLQDHLSSSLQLLVLNEEKTFFSVRILYNVYGCLYKVESSWLTSPRRKLFRGIYKKYRIFIYVTGIKVFRPSFTKILNMLIFLINNVFKSLKLQKAFTVTIRILYDKIVI